MIKNDEPKEVLKKPDKKPKKLNIFATFLEEEVKTILKEFEDYKSEDYKSDDYK